MKFNRNFTVQSDEATTRSRLITGMNLMRYRLGTSEPLHFDRGSLWGRWLSTSPADWKCDVTIEVNQSPAGETEVHVRQLPTYVATVYGWTVETQSILDFWMRELDLIESAAQGNTMVCK